MVQVLCHVGTELALLFNMWISFRVLDDWLGLAFALAGLIVFPITAWALPIVMFCSVTSCRYTCIVASYYSDWSAPGCRIKTTPVGKLDALAECRRSRLNLICGRFINKMSWWEFPA